ncbi:hypothetical protein [Legionella sp.]|uniref:hypothetical protein n=1 Tax=Legionella sp. TaxID=459 RepID=UPI003C8EBEE3
MPKIFTYRAVTANCGNDSIGELASKQIADLLIQDELSDFIIINCQEVDFEKTRLQLERFLNKKDYNVQCLAKMVTHTKLSTQFHSSTGIASYIIYKSDLTVNVHSEIAARRSNKRSSGSAYNKGGLVTDFTVTRKKGSPEEECLRIQAISGHLDSKHSTKRNEDWLNIHKASSKRKVKSWGNLVSACPNLKISGYDANLRDKLEGDYAINLLMDTPDDPEVEVLYRAPLADRTYSSEITYSKLGSESIEDPKRPGYSAQGMLDYMGISDGSEPKKENIITESVIKVDVENSSARDHAVLISPIQSYISPKSQFDVVKSQMASRLHYVAPELGKTIRAFDENDENSKKQLIKIYNTYLSTNGLLNKVILLQIKKLRIFNQLMDGPFLQNDEVKKELVEILFKNKNWCEGSSKNIVAIQDLTYTLIESLSCCNDEAGIKARLGWYHELGEKINQDQSFNPAEEFKKRVIDEYRVARNNFNNSLHNYEHGDNPEHKNFKEAGFKILKYLDLIAEPNPALFIQSDLDEKSIEKLTQIAQVCQSAYKEIRSPKDSVAPIIEKLNHFSQESVSKVSRLWMALRAALNAFIQCIRAIVGLPPVELNQSTKMKHLADSVASYKSALQKLHVQKEPCTDLKETPEVQNEEYKHSKKNP